MPSPKNGRPWNEALTRKIIAAVGRLTGDSNILERLDRQDNAPPRPLAAFASRHPLLIWRVLPLALMFCAQTVVQTAMYWGNAKTNGGAYPSTWLVIGLPCGLSFLADLNVFRYRRPAQEHPIVATAISATLVTFAWLLARFVAAPLLS